MSRFGRYHAPDDRDRKFALPVGAGKLPRSKHWRRGKRVFQGDTPRCVGYSGANWALGYPIAQYVNPDGLYTLAQFLDEWEGTDYDGTSVRAGAKVLAELGFIREYRWGFSIDAVLEALLTKGPIWLGTDWLRGMDEWDADGVIRATGRTAGGHAWIADGYDRRTGLVRGITSWRDFGLDRAGGLWLPAEDLEKLLERDGEACLPIEARPKL